jgi:pyruvate-formate lyase-activating enzyme
MRRKPIKLKEQPKRPEFLTALVANSNGEIFELEGYATVGMEGPLLKPLTNSNTLVMPHGSELMFLPDRTPILLNLESGDIETVSENPFEPGEPIFPVAAFNSPGYVLRYNCAYEERSGAEALPLFSYGAVGWWGESFRSAVIQVDKEPRQDLRRMHPDKVLRGVKKLRQKMPHNRLRVHLEKCALTYGCPAGKNFFLGRYEAPLPTSKQCNARCLGCISLQKDTGIRSSQDRIDFTPTAEDIAEIALTHIQQVPRAVVSFGQGCEGDPLMAAETIEEAIHLIRAATFKGTINMNTNASLPNVLERLFTAGLDSIRISMNSVRKGPYETYFRPRGYRFEDVVHSFDVAREMGAHIAVNYLNSPGFSDTPEELTALIEFIHAHPIDLIQWRNLNIDPLRYLRIMNDSAQHEKPVGMRTLLKRIKAEFPNIKYGYFNPPVR